MCLFSSFFLYMFWILFFNFCLQFISNHKRFIYYFNILLNNIFLFIFYPNCILSLFSLIVYLYHHFSQCFLNVTLSFLFWLILYHHYVFFYWLFTLCLQNNLSVFFFSLFNLYFVSPYIFMKFAVYKLWS